MYKILSFKIKDFQRIEIASAQLDPQSGITTVTGPNEQGKSAFLNAIASAVAKTPRGVQTPVHNGANKALVRLVLGEKQNDKGWESAYTIDRMWEKDASGKVTTSLRVLDNRTLKESKTPAELLKSLLGDTIIDPVDFVDRTTPAEQRKILMKLCGVDTDAIDAKIEGFQSLDTQLRAQQIAAEVNVSKLPHHPDIAEDVEIDITDIMSEINSLNELKSASMLRSNKAQTLASNVKACKEAEARALEAYNIAKQATLAAIAAESAFQRDAEAATATPLTIEEIDAQIAQAQARAQGCQALNAKIRENIAKESARKQWLEAEEQVAVNLNSLKAAKAERLAMLQSSQFPLPGLSVGPTYIEYNGMSFLDESRARQIFIATAIAVYRDAPLKVVLIRDAAVMDKKLLCELAELCDSRGAQMIVEIACDRTPDGGYDQVGDITFDGGVIVEVANA